MDTRPAAPASEISIQDAINIAQDGASVIGSLLGFIDGLIHKVGHVNHPIILDRIADALQHAGNLQSALEGAQEAAKATAPQASETP